MPDRDWLRILLCGMVAGVVWYLLSAVSLALAGQGLLAALQGVAPYPAMNGGFFFAIDLAMGVWTVWLYAALVPRYGAGMRTAGIAGVAWWTIKSLQSAKWAGFGLLPGGVVLAPLLTSLGASLIAAQVGAWLFSRVEAPVGSTVSPHP